MQKVIVATNNANKLKEIREILGEKFELVSLKDAGINVDPDEDGLTFEDNALIKARAIFEASNIMALADDSGLCVDALNGEPGIMSARYCGEHGNDKKNNEKLLKDMESVAKENRGAKFVSAVVLFNGKSAITVRGETKGEILLKSSGENGFGYDPLFYSYDLKKSFGEASSEEKNKISHRKRALEKLLRCL